MMVISLLITAIMILFSHTIADFLGFSDSAHYVTWFAWILALDAFTTLVYARFRLESKPYRFLIYRVANVLFTIFFVLFFLEFLPRVMPGVQAEINAYTGIFNDLDYVFLSNLLASLLVFLAMIPEMLKMKMAINKTLLTKVLKYSWPLVIIIVAGNINQNIAVPLQQFLIEGDVETRKAISGIYSAGAKLAILLNLFTTAFNYAAEPFFFNQAAKDKQYEMNGVIAKAFTIFSALVILGTYFYIDLVLLLIGSSYRGGVVVVPVLLLSYLFLGLYYNVSIWYKLADKTIYGAYIAVGGVVVTLVTSIILIPISGMMGSAWASLACFLFMAVSGYLQGQRYFPIAYPIRDIIKYCLITALLLAASWLVRMQVENLTFRLMINSLILVGFTAYILIFERAFIGRYIKKY
ncbi:MAG: polysaccharide biosynthesis protein [Saprospiraceae bacterium]|nr:polysaccharide biosynthesis protein [Saprospiraceae bacterium]